MTEVIDIDELVAEHARCWQAVGWSQSSTLYDPGLPHRKQEALEATQALKDKIERLTRDADVSMDAAIGYNNEVGRLRAAIRDIGAALVAEQYIRAAHLVEIARGSPDQP